MSKSINISTKDGQKYKLEFTRKTVKQMTENGFRLEDVKDKPIIAIPELFAGAFLANHRYLKESIIDDMYKGITNKDELIITLIEMYREPIEALMNEPEEGEGNVGWEVSE